ncbi:Uncharacterised protein [Mycobacterium tuberculosis]|nr:Uncharacterised protein [Mycobacterium tuberculosis]
MSPHHYSRRRRIEVSVQMRQQTAKGLRHVLVAQVPRGNASTEHGPVIHLCVAHRLRVLLGVEQFVLGKQPVLARIRQGIALNVDQLLDGFTFARRTGAECGRESVRLTVIGAGMVEARIPGPRPCRRTRVDLVEIADHLLDRPMQAVKIQTVEAGLPQRARLVALVACAQPFHKISDHGVAPHPGGKPLESAKRLVSVGVLAEAANVPIDPVGVGPVRLGGYRTKALLLDQPLCHGGPGLVELVCAVRAFADQHDSCIADQLRQHLVRRNTPGGVDRDSAQNIGRR